ncbi:hypothetical protein CC86DRAFT_275558, partial [Ophiobolus disseminans]
LEKGLHDDGYPAFGRFLAQDPDNETLIFRRFDRLAALNLLYLQAEVYEIQRRIREFEKEVIAKGDIDLLISMKRWETFVEKAECSYNRPEQEMKKLILTLRKVMKEYHEALILQVEISKLSRPGNRALKYVHRWFSGKSRGKKSAILAGEASRMLENQDDLAALKVPEEDDRLSQLMRDYWSFSGTSGGNPSDKSRYFRLRHVTRTVAIISTIVAAVELVGAITTLYFVQSREVRIGLIALFTSLFGFSLCLLTNARRGEIFGASAAYAAVL